MAETGFRDSPLLSIIQGAGWHIIGKLVANFFGLFTTMLLTRGLGASVYGIFALCLTIVSVIGSVSNLGSDKAVLKFLAEDEADKGSQLGFSYIVVVFGGGIAGAILYIVAPIISSYTVSNNTFIISLRLFALYIVINPITVVTANALRAFNLPEYSSLISRISRAATKFVCVLGAFLLSTSIFGFIIAVLISSSATVLIGLAIIIRKTSVRPEIPGDEFQFGSYLNFSIPLAFKDAGSVLYTRVDILMLGIFAASASVGQYQVTILLSTVLTMPLSAINQIFPPIISNLNDQGETEELAQIYSTVTRWTFAATIPMAVGLIAYRYEILALFGKGFTTAAFVLVVLTVGQLTNAFVGPSGYLLMMTDHQYVITTNQWIFGLLNVAGNLLLIQWYGVLGAAIATATTLTLINLARLIQVYYFEGMHPLTSKISKPIVAVGVMLTAILGIQAVFDGRSSLVLGLVVAPITYFGCLTVFGLEPEDKELITKAKENF
ncbi:oligosaccharide flippase family protein [Halobaculum sp. WSA2]|uniref:Oligosaccharide flippase family protein n=1 Tax=Halobaculum saliterrae TaxID=2073113 RepID=A0A6B0SVX0_9EURY|nr:oligosaccharide flippase family protein [Halobaculum saliterrae]MXR40773.1 oligosaccharide flippase family protein [Halobaculum saliterrae]